MMRYPSPCYIMYSLKKLKFYGGRGPDNPSTLLARDFCNTRNYDLNNCFIEPFIPSFLNISVGF